jgi:hypothetical protein
MPALLPTDIMNGLNQVNVLNPIQAAQARAMLEQTQLKNQGIPAENAQMLLQNTGMQQGNERFAASTPDILAQLRFKTGADQDQAPVNKLAAKEATLKGTILDQLSPAFGGTAQPPQAPEAAQMGPQSVPEAESAAMKLLHPNAATGGIQDKPLSELRKMVSGAGPMSDYMGGMLKPTMDYKSLHEEVIPAISEMAEVSKMPGASREEARLKAAAISAIDAKYPMAVDNPKYKDAKATAMPKNPDVVFNPAGMANVNAKLKGTLITDFAKERKDYNTKANAYVTARGIQNSDAWGSGTGDQNLMDQMIIAETGKPPTEAQYYEQAKKYGFLDAIDLISGKIRSDAKLSNKVRNNIMSDLESQAKINQQIYQAAITHTSERARKNEIDPADILETGGNMDMTDSLLTHPVQKPASPGSARPAAVRIKRAQEYMALPVNSPLRTPDHEAAAKKILGLVQ